MPDERVFWAEQIAGRVKERKKFHFVDAQIEKRKQWSVKSSSSLSGVLHIGRLSDVIRGEAVFRALQHEKFPAQFIYVTEDMDPLRKIPKGVPKKFEKYIGFPVSDVPDPLGCHKSYAKHFVAEFFSVLQSFLCVKPRVFSMREEYKKGSFTDSIIKLVEERDAVKQIIERRQKSGLPSDWFPWKPICDNCGNLQTTVLTGIDGNEIQYECRDYNFESAKAKGCGHKGSADLSKANGKLVWKAEWAAQWKTWGVCSEGAGKEYESQNSAFWVNAEICEKVLRFPHPEPIFYEYLMVDGVKMSASLGNVVYPKQFVSVARPEALKYLYMKRLMKSRSFSWSDVPLLELQLDRALQEKGNKLGAYSAVKGRKLVSLPVDYSLIAYLVQLFKGRKETFNALREMGHLTGKEPKDVKKLLGERISLATAWVESYAPPEFKIRFLEKLGADTKERVPGEAKKALLAVAAALPKKKKAGAIQKLVFNAAKEQGIAPKQLFRAIYLALLGKEFGPKVGSLVIALGKKKCAERMKEAAT